MIENVKNWLSAIVAAAMLISAAQSLVPKGTFQRIARLTGSLALAVVMLRPALDIPVGRLLPEYEGLRREMLRLEEAYEAENEAAIASVIEERLASYIEDKADELGLTCTVQVKTQGSPPQLSAVILKGASSPELESYIRRELGVETIIRSEG